MLASYSWQKNPKKIAKNLVFTLKDNEHNIAGLGCVIFIDSLEANVSPRLVLVNAKQCRNLKEVKTRTRNHGADLMTTLSR